MAKKKSLDAFEKVKAEGRWPEVKDAIYDLSVQGFSEGYIGARLFNVDKAAFSRLKRDHQEIQEVFNSADDVVVKDLMASMMKLARGAKYKKQKTHLEEINGTKIKKVIDKDEYEVPPDYRALHYMLRFRGGKEFHERREEIEAEERKEADKETW